MTDVPRGIDTGAVRTEARRAETGPTRQEALNAFNSSFAFFDSATNITPQQEAARERAREAKAKILDKGRDSRRITVHDEYGIAHRPTEYMPVDDLLEFLVSQVEAGDLDPAMRDEITKNIRILNSVSKSYLRIPKRAEAVMFKAKVNQEYEIITNDPRLTSGDPVIDWAEATAKVNKRRELVLPKETDRPSPDGAAPIDLPVPSTLEGLAGEPDADAPPTLVVPRPQVVQIPPDLESRMTELAAEGRTDTEIDEILRRERGNNWRDAIRIVDAPPVDGVPPKPTELVTPSPTPEVPNKIAEFRVGMNILEPTTGEIFVVDSIYEKPISSYSNEDLAMFDKNTVTILNPITGERRTIETSVLIGKVNEGKDYRPDNIEGVTFRNTKTGEVLTARTGYRDGRLRVSLVDSSGKEKATGKRDAFDVALADGDYEVVTPIPPSPAGSTTLPSASPSFLRRLPPAPPAPPTPPTPPAPEGPVPLPPAPIPGSAPAPAPSPPPSPDAGASAPTDPLDVDAPIDEPAADETAPGESIDADVEAEGPPAPPTIEEVREYLFMIASRSSDVSKRARELAEEHLRTEMRRGSILNPLNWKRKIGWRMVEHGMRQHFTERARRLLIQSGNTYADIDLARNAVRDAGANRGQEYQAGVAKAEAIKSGETTARSGLVQEIGDGPLKDAIMSQIIRPAVEGTLTDMADVQRILRQFVIDNQSDAQVNHVFGTDATQFGELADYFATDLLETARQIREDVAAHRFSLDQIDRVVKIQLANARWGANSEMAASGVDRFIQWTQSTRLKGTIFNPAVIGAGISLATYGLTAIPGAAMRAGTAMPLVGAIPAAFYGAARRAHDLRVDITKHRTERVYNSSPLPPNADRRRGLEQFSYLTASVNDLRKGYSPDSRQPRTLGGDARGFEELLRLDLSQEGNRNALMRRMADARARLDFAYGDILTFESRYEVEQGRLAVIKDIAEATTALRNSGMSDTEINSAVGAVYSTFQAEFIDQARAQERAFSGGNLIERYFTSYRAREALKSGAFAGAVGAVGGLVSQQVLATGLRTFGVNVRSTILENVVSGARASERVGGAGVATLLSADTPLVDSKLGGHKISIPQGTVWEKGPDGKMNLTMGGKTLLQDVWFDKKGGLHFDKDSILAGEVSESRGEVTRREVLGKRGLWNEAATHIDRREWYAYNKPESQGNELRFTTGKRGNGVILSLEGMGLGRQEGLKPNPIDVRELRNKGFFISLGGNSEKPIWIPVTADGRMDGKLRLDPDDYKNFITRDGKRIYLGDIAKIIINQEALGKLKDGNIATELYGRRDVWSIAHNGKNGAIEAGRLIKRNGQDVAQIFATILGSCEVPDQIKTIGTSSIEIGAIDLPTETPTPIDVPPIVLPFAPRFPLESLGQYPMLPETILSTYYGGESLKSLQEWIRNNPSRLKPYKKRVSPDGREIWIGPDGKEVKRNVDLERDNISHYMDEIRSSDPAYYAELERLVTEPTMHPMLSETRASVNIPAWMEGKNIYGVLEQYTQQTDRAGSVLDPSLYEINIIVNRKRGTDSDNTVSEINRFIEDSRNNGLNFNINFIDLEFDPPFNNVGHARKVITDLTLLRSLRRSTQTGELYIESEDADLITVDKNTIINLIETLDNNPHLDAVRGIQDRLPEVMMNNDLLFVQRRMWDFTELLLRKNKFRPENNPRWNFTWNRVITGGWNTGYTASSYALIGGYDSRQTKGEDMTIGEKITMARGDGQMPNLDVVGRVYSRSNSSPRRFITEILTGRGAYTDSFEDAELNNFIKNASLDDLLARISGFSRLNDTNSGHFGGLLDGHFQSIKSLTPNEAEARMITESLLFYLGLKRGDYEFTPDGHLKIGNWSNLSQALNDYRRKHTKPVIPPGLREVLPSGPSRRPSETEEEVPEESTEPPNSLFSRLANTTTNTFRATRSRGRAAGRRAIQNARNSRLHTSTQTGTAPTPGPASFVPGIPVPTPPTGPTPAVPGTIPPPTGPEPILGGTPPPGPGDTLDTEAPVPIPTPLPGPAPTPVPAVPAPEPETEADEELGAAAPPEPADLPEAEPETTGAMGGLVDAPLVQPRPTAEPETEPGPEELFETTLASTSPAVTEPELPISDLTEAPVIPPAEASSPFSAALVDFERIFDLFLKEEDPIQKHNYQITLGNTLRRLIHITGREEVVRGFFNSRVALAALTSQRGVRVPDEAYNRQLEEAQSKARSSLAELRSAAGITVGEPEPDDSESESPPEAPRPSVSTVPPTSAGLPATQETDPSLTEAEDRRRRDEEDSRIRLARDEALIRTRVAADEAGSAERLAASAPAVPEARHQPEPEAPETSEPAQEPTSVEPETSPALQTFTDESGQSYELLELDSSGARVRYPDGTTHYLPRDTFELYSSGEFFNPNLVAPIAVGSVPQAPVPSEPVTVAGTQPTAASDPTPQAQTQSAGKRRLTNDEALRRSVEVLNSVQQRAKSWQPNSTMGRVARLGTIATAQGAKGKATLARLTGFVKPDKPPED